MTRRRLPSEPGAAAEITPQALRVVDVVPTEDDSPLYIGMLMVGSV